MNIFLDTSVLYSDPFWKGNFFNELKEIVKDKEIDIYMSEIVLRELRHNYKKIIKETELQLDKANSQIEKYNIAVTEEPIIDIEASMQRFDIFYKELTDENIVTILSYSNDYLPEIVDRAIERKKPFTESKTELKDCIIWLTYCKYAEERKLKDCILLICNISDFCDSDEAKNKNYIIHSELAKDSDRFKVYLSPKDLIQREKQKLQSVSQRFDAWLKEQEFNSEFVLTILQENFEKEITRKVEREYERLEPHDLIDDDYYVTGYVSPGFFEILEVENVGIDVFNEECIISGDVLVRTAVEMYEYNSVRDPGEDSHRYYGEIDNIVKISFSFYYDKNEYPRNLNLDDVEIENA